MAAPVVFLPAPRDLTWGDDGFTLTSASVIVLPPAASAVVRTAARSLQLAIADATGLTVLLQPGPAPGPPASIVLAIDPALATTLPFPLAPALQAQAFTLAIGADGVTITGGGEAGLAYGVAALTQLVAQRGRALPTVAVADAPALPVRGLMLDVSRGKVPTMATLLALVEQLAHFRYNQLQLYTEHTFAFPRHPSIGAGADPLTADDILVLDARCRELGIDLVPNWQAIGHQAVMLAQPEYAPLAETPWNWSLATGREDSFTLTAELFDDLLPAFSSAYFNINGDEPWDLGRGQSRERANDVGYGRLYLEHILRLHQLVTARGRTMMIWADMFWHYPELVGEFPADIVLLDWWYERRERHDSVDMLAAANRRFYVCPGTSSWLALYPRLDNAIANIENFVRDGIAAGAEGMLLTDWGDQGHFNPLSNSWYPYLWGASCAWTGCVTTLDDFETAFSRIFLGDPTGTQVAAMRALGATTQVATDWHHTWHTAMALWEDPLTGKQALQTTAADTAAALSAAATALAVSPGIRDATIRHDFAFAAAQIAFATRKVDTARALRQFVADASPAAMPGDQDELLGRGDALLSTVTEDRLTVRALAAEYEVRWRAHARESELRVTQALWRGLLGRYDAVITWLTQQLIVLADGGTIDAELLTYDAAGYAVLHDARWLDIQALIDVIGFEQLPPDLQTYVKTRQAAEGTPEP